MCAGCFSTRVLLGVQLQWATGVGFIYLSHPAALCREGLVRLSRLELVVKLGIQGQTRYADACYAGCAWLAVLAV